MTPPQCFTAQRANYAESRTPTFDEERKFAIDEVRLAHSQWFPLYRPNHLSGLKTSYSGSEASGTSSSGNHCLATGCFKKDPCR